MSGSSYFKQKEDPARHLLEDYGYALDHEPALIFNLPPTPAAGDPGSEVVLRGYLISKDTPSLEIKDNVREIAWVNTKMLTPST